MNHIRDLMDGNDPATVGGASQPVPAAPAVGTLRQGQGQFIALLQFTAAGMEDSDPHGIRLKKTPKVVCITVSGTGGTGPLVGRLQWGSGRSAMFAMEFDIPMPGAIGAAFDATNTSQQPTGGILLAVPANALDLAVRNDANMRPRAADTAVGNPDLGISTASANLGTGSRNSSPLTRTVFGAYNPAAGLAALDFCTIAIPPFSRTFNVFRTSTGGVAAVACTVEVLDVRGQTLIGPIAVAAGAASPEFPVPVSAGMVRITNTGGVAATAVGAVFTLAP